MENFKTIYDLLKGNTFQDIQKYLGTKIEKVYIESIELIPIGHYSECKITYHSSKEGYRDYDGEKCLVIPANTPIDMLVTLFELSKEHII
ncbi:hypothetical protein [Clostridium weizhouense]|uniref:Uncharacterized protein n=1 Tax=Clostridium weizhouense TaxID=2859781 RepID=A0ABS7AJY3_9CLOT|nr:hypothetical protein [Clostridium weizhouense]MBW6408980.1 hypothetical protein [Clostridium weizhouense]